MTDSVLARFQSAYAAFGLSSDKPVLLALSGGCDSMALFHLLRDAEIPFAAAHVNYGLRAQDSDEDARFCGDICQRFGIPFFLHTCSPENFSGGSGIQKKAREIRYSFFRRLLKENAFSGILTAHHAGDRAETLLLHLFRGTGIRGLAGMRSAHEGIYRPLLDFKKEELKCYLEERGFNWREDASNLKNDYTRNRIRNKLMPFLQAEFPGAEEAIIQTASHMAADAHLFDFLITQAGLLIDEGISIKKLFSFPSDLRISALFHVCRPFGLSYEQAANLYDLLKENKTGKAIFTATHRFLVDRDYLLISPLSSEKSEAVFLSEDLTPGITGYALRLVSPKELPDLGNPRHAFLDAASLQFPLIWRIWEPGDRMIPLGMKGSKKVSDILTDRKISRFAKEQIHVLVSGNKILWLEGVCPADSSKVCAHTSRVLAIMHEK
jgi:tRNA(Ile)-lysidine synthase